MRNMFKTSVLTSMIASLSGLVGAAGLAAMGGSAGSAPGIPKVFKSLGGRPYLRPGRNNMPAIRAARKRRNVIRNRKAHR